MLCGLCETFIADLTNQDYSNWNRLNEDEYGFKHGDHESISASAAAGCQTCQLFCLVRRKKIPGYESLGEKWLMKNAMVLVDMTAPLYTFHLLSEGPDSSWLSFELFQPLSDGKDGKTPNLEDGLPCEVTSSPLSDHPLGLARGWVEQCRYHHKSCLLPDKTPLPTRVIDVGYSDEEAFARLQVNRGQLGRYVTLSHCWGEGKRLVTMRRNLKEFQNAIPHRQMPKTFQDAITLTRLLGMRYLWIDALCIIQDDREDWRRESAMMCSVYENAAFSISALSAVDSGSGFLHDRDIDQCIVTVGESSVGVRPRLILMEEALEGSRLESRAWCLQERVLAPAVLQVGAEQLYWECRCCIVSESFPTGQPDEDSSKASQSSPTHIPDTRDRELLLRLWYDLVRRYSARDLTKPSDRLPAIAGLADKIKRELGGSPPYVNGLWIDDLVVGLLWQRPSQHAQRPSFRAGEARPYPENIAPSWSWASVRGAVEYTWQTEMKFRSPSRQDLAASIDASAQTVLQVEGLVKRGVCRLSSSSSSTLGNSSFKPSGSSLVMESISCVLDNIDDVVPSHCYCLWISTWTPTAAQKSKKSKAASRVFFLVLERVLSSADESRPSTPKANSFGRFKRIGMGYDTNEKVGKVFSNAGRHSLELV